MLVPWSVLQPSLRAQRWRQVGCGIGVAASVALFAAAFASAPFDAGLLILAGIVGACSWASLRGRAGKRFETGVSLDGEIRLRECLGPEGAISSGGGSTESLPLHVSFASPWLISLRSGTMFIPIWPDCLPPSIYRELWVHLHWGRAAPGDDDRQSTPTTCGKSMAR